MNVVLDLIFVLDIRHHHQRQPLKVTAEIVQQALLKRQYREHDRHPVSPHHRKHPVNIPCLIRATPQQPK